jgi:cysteine synthase B
MSLHSNRRARSVVDLIGNTPLIRLRSVEERAGGGVEIWAKCEFENPGGSVKDRAARQMILDALADGSLTGKRLIDSTSGNTGVAYSMIGAALGIPITLVMPANVSVARKNITRAYGTELVFSSELEGSDGAIALAKQMADESPDTWFYPNQYANPGNPKAHYLGTGAEILRSLGDRITHFATGIGTTGTIMGTGRRLKEHDRPIEVIAIEPADAFHGLEGLKHMASSLVPPIWHRAGVRRGRGPVQGRGGVRRPLGRGQRRRRLRGGAPGRQGRGGGDRAAGSRRPLLRPDEVGEAVCLVRSRGPSCSRSTGRRAGRSPPSAAAG